MGWTLKSNGANKMKAKGAIEEHFRGRPAYQRTFNVYPKMPYLYLRCRRCPSFVNYKWNGTEMVVSKADPYHEHEDKVGESKAVIEYMREHNGISTKDCKLLVMRRFNITSARFYYLLRRMRHDYNCIGDILQSLESMGYSTVYES